MQLARGRKKRVDNDQSNVDTIKARAVSSNLNAPVGKRCSVMAGGGMAGFILTGVVVFGQSLDGYAYPGIDLIVAGVIVLIALSTAVSE